MTRVSVKQHLYVHEQMCVYISTSKKEEREAYTALLEGVEIEHEK